MDEDDLRTIAEECRRRFERASGPGSHIAFWFFPRGSCGAVADLLARFLVERHGLDAKVVEGLKDQANSHGWVLVNETIIDITADQFEGQPSVFVGAESAWHNGWETTLLPYAGPNEWPDYPYDVWQILIE